MANMSSDTKNSPTGIEAPTQAELERYSKRWWRNKNLRSLNAWMLIPLISIFAQG